MPNTLILKGDNGATYLCRKDDSNPFGETMWTFQGNLATYSSKDNDLRYTGQVRNHPRVGKGRRSLMVLDTGEGIVTIPGVILTANVY